MQWSIQTKIPPPVYALVAALTMWGLDQFLPLAEWEAPALRWVVICLVVIGLSLDFTSLALFVKQQTTVNPIHPRKAAQLVTSGCYRFSRNPMYLGMLCLLAAWSLHLSSLSPLLVLLAFVWVINEMQIKPEEAVLQEKFGDTYIQYRHAVRRWI